MENPRLPPGFRFHPTDEEIVVQYLKRKVQSYPLPASIIPEADVSKSDPWNLPGDSQQEMFFFCMKEFKYPNGNRSNRATPSGFWKATGSDKQIIDSGANRVVGMKKILVFYLTNCKSPKTNWVMHEYRLAKAQAMEKWVVCKIFLKKRGRNGKEDVAGSSSSGSSGITNASTGKDEDEESSESRIF